MRIVIVSDTHKKLSQLKIPDGDMLIHCGDFTMKGDLSQVEQFNRDMGALPHRWKIATAGNHDFPFERQNAEARALLSNAIYLQDELVEINGLRFYGSPWQPEYRKFAFNHKRSSPELAAVWAKVPDKVDVLITHGPPKGILDRTPLWPTIGDELLLERVLQVRPRLHCFGHCHHSYGRLEQDGITYINAASCDENYNPRNAPQVIDID